jgi:hypothetical protein
VVTTLEWHNAPQGFTVPASGELRLWVTPEGEVESVATTHSHWLTIHDPEGLAESLQGQFGEEDELDDFEDALFNLYLAQGWVRVVFTNNEFFINAGMPYSMPKAEKALRAVVRDYPDTRFPKFLMVNDLEIPVDDGEDVIDAFRHRNSIRKRVQATLVFHADTKIDNLLKLARGVIQDDPRWKGYQDDLAKADELGRAQRLASEARTREDLDRIWEEFDLHPALDVLADRAAAEADKGKAEKDDKVEPKKSKPGDKTS